MAAEDGAYDGPDRRAHQPMQRDWLSHGLQLALVLGMLIAAWVAINGTVSSLSAKVDGINDKLQALQTTTTTLSSSTAVLGILSNRTDRDEHDISDLRASLSALAAQVATGNQQLAVIDSKLGEILTKQRPPR